MTELLEEIKESMMINKKNTGRVIMSLGTKSGGKSFLMNQYLRYCFAHKLYDIYMLVLPSYDVEANDSYSFIDEKNKDILIFTEYNEALPDKIMKYQRKLIDKKQQKKKILFVIDDASGEHIDSFHLDPNLKRLITSIRHFNCMLWMIVHAVSGCVSTFARANTDVLIMYNITNQNLLENLYDEYLSLNPQFRQGANNKQNKQMFIDYFLKLMSKEYQALYLNLRNKNISPDVYEVAGLLAKS